ncbi:hypothetical protein evm_014870 [Chilo suppressalis]|nr:hypothetical protein evm_014870 [Chilo suppressalis]
MNLLIEPYISPRKKAELVHNITLADLTDFSDRMLDHIYLQVLMQGNIPWYEAIRIAENVQNNLRFEGPSPDELPKSTKCSCSSHKHLPPPGLEPGTSRVGDTMKPGVRTTRPRRSSNFIE